ncbi:MAG: 5-(carboxyamino)imidazole ribonucleotide mutase [Thermoanaerobaculia bacterium]|nr:5-(carboxyamino)imidazole ribonucleotide mutase [Thermoanaerobaculia bacterium]
MPAMVSVLMGSRSDWPVMQHCAATLEELGIGHDVRVLSAHRTPEALFEYVAGAERAGTRVFIAAAGGAAHLAGVVAAKTTRPVLAVPMESKIQGIDSLLSMVQMPAGVPVATFAIGKAGAVNAALFAGQVLGVGDAGVAERVADDRRGRAARVLADPDPRQPPPSDG